MTYEDFQRIIVSEGLDLEMGKILWEVSPEQNGQLDEPRLRRGCRELIDTLGHHA